VTPVAQELVGWVIDPALMLADAGCGAPRLRASSPKERFALARDLLFFARAKKSRQKKALFPDGAILRRHCYGDFSIRRPWRIEKRRTSCPPPSGSPIDLDVLLAARSKTSMQGIAETDKLIRTRDSQQTKGGETWSYRYGIDLG
jgi:hypothetical protein